MMNGTVLVFFLQSAMAPGQAVMVSAALAMTGSLVMGATRTRAVGATAIVLCAISTIYPAWRGARTQPAEALRYE